MHNPSNAKPSAHPNQLLLHSGTTENKVQSDDSLAVNCGQRRRLITIRCPPNPKQCC